jgi:hypothetical protein
MSAQAQPGEHENLLWFLLALVVGIAVLAALLLPATVHSGPSTVGKIYSRLRQIELAKQMWAEDHGATGSARVTEQDLAPYLRRPSGSTGLVDSVVGEQYRINAVGVEPEATLTRQLGKGAHAFPKGTVIRLRANAPLRYDIVLPNPAAQPESSTGH